MKVFISCDIEGVTTTTRWEQTYTSPEKLSWSAPFQAQMTREVVAACNGAIRAGATEIFIKDAHGAAINIDPHALPECAKLCRNWSGHPYGMVEGVDNTFDAAMFVGYHSAAGREGSPMSHTRTTSTTAVKLNGKKFSEFEFYSLACALEGVPSVLLTGDQMLIDDTAYLHPCLKSVAVKEGWGGRTISIAPSLAEKRIEQAAFEALSQDFKGKLPEIPKHFVLEITYKDHVMATKMSYFPGFRKCDDNSIVMETDDLVEVLRALRFVL
ncbi:MAG: aminopeptidase [Ruminococcaceae bacterium]|nr:aminopeptidase [Oscillospiraceae bacterium]